MEIAVQNRRKINRPKDLKKKKKDLSLEDRSVIHELI